MQVDLPEPVTAAWPDPLSFSLIAVAAAASAAVAALIIDRLRRGQPVVAWRPHEPVPWAGADVALVLLAALLVASLGQEFGGESASPVRRLGIHVATLAVGTALGMLMLRGRGASWGDLGLRGRWPEDLRIAAGALALIVAPLLALAAVLNQIVPYRHPIVDLLADRRDPTALAAVLVSALVAAPVAEEFFFRRVLQGWLERQFPDAAGATAILLSSAAFALAHLGQGLAYWPLLPFGIVLGLIARQTGSIVACILVHAAFNAISVGILLAGT